MANNECPICKKANVSIKQPYGGADSLVINCPNCDSYEISNSAIATLSNRPKDFELSYAIRRRSIRKEKVFVYSTNRADIIAGIEIPKGIKNIAEALLLDVYKDDSMMGRGLVISNDNIFSFAIESIDKLPPVLKYIEDAGWFSLERLGSGAAYLNITGHGIKHAEEILNPNFRSTQVFVAMSFNSELDAIYHEAIKTAVDECGLNPIRIDLVDFNDEIILNVLNRINQSKFLIADYTDNRPGVYFETGYALGKGLPIIYCCRESDKDNIHFDVNHYKFIHWKEASDFKAELVKRITNTGLNS